MIKKLLNFSEGMYDHIESYEKAYNMPNTSEAIRQLILAGFTYFGNPYIETADLTEKRRMSPGRPSIAKLEAESVGIPEPDYAKFQTEYYRNLYSQKVSYDDEQ